MKSFRDPVYDYIDCNSAELAIIDSPWFQRLRHCSQNGTARLVYPTLMGSRFEHSLGVMHLAEKMLRSVLHPAKLTGETRKRFHTYAKRDIVEFYGSNEKSDLEIEEQLVHWIRLAGLCHDLGHFPLSHTIEAVFHELFWKKAFPVLKPRRACHEVISAEIVRQIAFRYGENPLFSSGNDQPIISKLDARAIILLLLLPEGVFVGERPIRQSVFSMLHPIIVGTYDADRLDYLQRDTHLASANIGLIDIERFFDSLQLVERPAEDAKTGCHYVIMPSPKAISAIETLLIERYKQKKWVHFHHKVVFYDRMAREAGMAILQNAESEFFSNIPQSEIYPKSIANPAELSTKYREQLQLQLGKGGELGPLSIYGTPGNYSVLDCAKLVNNSSSHFIDDIWFSQRCRDILKSSHLHGILVDRKPMGMSVWKTPDLFAVFWDAFWRTLDGDDRFWSALGVESQRDLPSPKDTVKLGELLTPIFRGDQDRYSEFFGLEQSEHFPKIEQYLTEKLSIRSGSIDVKMAHVRWKNLFFDDMEGIYGFDGKERNLTQYSGLVKSLIGLRGEILFYLYLVGDETDILRLREPPDAVDRNCLVKELADHFAGIIIDSLGSWCASSQVNRQVARGALLAD